MAQDNSGLGIDWGNISKPQTPSSALGIDWSAASKPQTPKPTATVEAQPHPIAQRIGDFANDIKYGPGVNDTRPEARLLRAIGFSGTETGGTGQAGSMMPITAAVEGVPELVHAASRVPQIHNKQSAEDVINEGARGAFKTAAGIAPIATPKILPSLLPAAATGSAVNEGAQKTASLFGASPETSELIGNAATIALPGVHAAREKLGNFLTEKAPAIGKVGGYGVAAGAIGKSLANGHPVNPLDLIFASPLTTKPIEAGARAAGSTVGSLPPFSSGSEVPEGSTGITNPVFSRGKIIPHPVAPEPAGLLSQGPTPLGEGIPEEGTPQLVNAQAQVVRGKGGRMTRQYTAEPSTGQVQYNPPPAWRGPGSELPSPVNVPTEPQGEVLPLEPKPLVQIEPLTKTPEPDKINNGGISQEPAEPAPVTERRSNTERRKSIDEMSPEEMKQALLTSEKTGLPNRRAFDDAETKEPAPIVGMSDADGLKALNDRFGYEAGDQLLKAKAEALKEAGLDAYHEKGDEFLYRGENPEELNEKLEKAREIFRNRTIEVKMKDGSTRQFKGADFSYGTGEGLDQAESGLKTNKEEREASGQRARGELRGITEVGSEPGQVDKSGPNPLIGTGRDTEEKGLQQDLRENLERSQEASDELGRKQLYAGNKVYSSRKTGKQGYSSPDLDESKLLPWAETPWGGAGNKDLIDTASGKSGEYEPQEGASTSMRIGPKTQNFINPFSGKYEPEPKFDSDELEDLYRDQVLEGMEKTHGELIHTSDSLQSNEKPKIEPTQEHPESWDAGLLDHATDFIAKELGEGSEPYLRNHANPEDIISLAKDLGWKPPKK